MDKIIVLYGTAPNCLEEPYDPIYNKNYGTIIGVFNEPKEIDKMLDEMKENGFYEKFEHISSRTFYKNKDTNEWDEFGQILHKP